MKEQPSEQTVREILIKYWGDVDLSTASDKAEAAINAHIVNVLEEIKSHQQSVLDVVYPEEKATDMVRVSVIDAAIAKYKQGNES